MTNPAPSLSPVRIALLGYGTIGSSLHRLLVEHRDHIRHATGRDLIVTCALVRDTARPRDAVVGGGEQLRLVDTIDAVLADEPDIVCEALGGLDPARGHVIAALQRGISVVTANKQLVAHHGTELFAVAEAGGAQLRFEASTCGAVPIIRMLRESLTAARIDRVLGILNGTTNFMLTAMAEQGSEYADALVEAQRLGYAEPDPTDDVTGVDVAAKLAILAGLAFHQSVEIDAVHATGIDSVTAEDIAYAHVLGCKLRLIGRAERIPDANGDRDAISLDVATMLVPDAHPLASITGSTNAVLVDGAPFRQLVIQGPGAGGPETASALAGDIVGVMGSSPSFLTRDPHQGPATIASPDARHDRFYLRMQVADRPGVLATVAGSLAARDVSIERVVQQRGIGGSATLVLVTHPTTRSAITSSLDAGELGFAADHTIMPILAIGADS